jgi:hypothetical protein
MTRALILICAMYAFSAVLFLVAHLAIRGRGFTNRPHAQRAYTIMEYVGKSSAGFAVGLTVLILLSLTLRWAGLLPPIEGR